MFEISLNGKPESLPEALSLLQAIEQWQPDKPFAVAVNGEFVPRSLYADTALNAGDSVDIVSPVAGG